MKKRDLLATGRSRYLASKRLQTIPTAEAAKELGVCIAAVSRYRTQAGIATPLSAREIEFIERRKRLIVDPEFGMETKQALASLETLARRHSLAPSTIRKILIKNDVFFFKKLVQESWPDQAANQGKRNMGSRARPRAFSKEIRALCEDINGWLRPEGMREYIVPLIHRKRAELRDRVTYD